jgi:hypothetical protein
MNQILNNSSFTKHGMNYVQSLVIEPESSTHLITKPTAGHARVTT